MIGESYGNDIKRVDEGQGKGSKMIWKR